jgi:hypothetical protein
MKKEEEEKTLKCISYQAECEIIHMLSEEKEKEFLVEYE